MASFSLVAALRFQELYIVILSKKQCPCIIYCWVTDYPNFSSLKQKSLIFSQFPWVRDVGVILLGPLAQGLLQSCIQLSQARHLKAVGLFQAHSNTTASPQVLH